VKFDAPPLEGSGSRWISIPVTGYTSDGESFSGTAMASERISGSTVFGWIVRLVSQGDVIRIDSNQPGLKSLDPKLLEKAIATMAR
jgi:hypothetical protein